MNQILANCVFSACLYYVAVQIVVLQQKRHMCCVVQPRRLIGWLVL